mmetsp:Transcript_31403/g.75978  ORF Transcript_31403/g.75978 Transcript_31403/m.75978 type:complete len:201 (+) Transcript_31403:1298-1900(+)
MTCDDLVEMTLSSDQCLLERSKVFNVWRDVANLRVDSRESTATHPVLPMTKVNEKKAGTTIRTLQVWCNSLSYVRACTVDSHRKFAWSLGDFVATACSHGEGILSTVNANTKLKQRVSQSNTRVPHLSTFTRQLCSIHPVATCFCIFDLGELSPDEVGHGLCNRHPCHSARIDQTLYRLFATCHSCTCNTEVAMCRNSNV